MRTALITGVTGQDGFYLARLLAERGYRVVGVVGPESQPHAVRIDGVPNVEIVRSSLLDGSQLRRVIEKYAPQEIYNLAARASSSQFFAEPVLTGEVNGLAVAKLLEAIRSVDATI